MAKKTDSDDTTGQIQKMKAKYDLIPSVREIVSSGVLGLDLVTHIGGIPRGCIMDLYGEEGLGKTTLALTMIGERVRNKERCAYIDVEHRLNPDLVSIAVGEDWDQYLDILQPKNAESALNEVVELSKMPDIRMIIVDSVAALIPEHCIENVEKEQTAEISRMMASHLKGISRYNYEYGSITVYINQIRSRPMVIGPVTSQPTGGRALKFYASLRLNIIRNSYIRGDEQIDGQRMDIILEKNTFAAPHGRTTMSIIYGEGIDKMRDVIDWAMKLGITTQSSSWFKYPYIENGEEKEVKCNGEEAFVIALQPLYQQLYDQVKATYLKSREKNKDVNN